MAYASVDAQLTSLQNQINIANLAFADFKASVKSFNAGNQVASLVAVSPPGGRILFQSIVIPAMPKATYVHMIGGMSVSSDGGSNDVYVVYLDFGASNVSKSRYQSYMNASPGNIGTSLICHSIQFLPASTGITISLYAQYTSGTAGLWDNTGFLNIHTVPQ